MKERIIHEDAAGQRIDRYLAKLLPGASKGLLQKSLRKKNIKRNGALAKPSDLLQTGDVITIYFSDNAWNTFTGESEPTDKLHYPKILIDAFNHPVYEDDSFIVINKPAGILSQPDATGDPSLAQLAAERLGDSESTFSPAPLNRLDRTTSGAVIIPKTYAAQKAAAEAIRERRSEKEYLALAAGRIVKPGRLEANLTKIESQNRSQITETGTRAVLNYEPVEQLKSATLLKVSLETGRSHQIRVQLKAAGHPVIGDGKYGDRRLNEYYKKNAGLTRQFLHAVHYKLYNTDGSVLLDATAPLPEELERALAGANR